MSFFATYYLPEQVAHTLRGWGLPMSLPRHALDNLGEAALYLAVTPHGPCVVLLCKETEEPWVLLDAGGYLEVATQLGASDLEAVQALLRAVLAGIYASERLDLFGAHLPRLTQLEHELERHLPLLPPPQL